MGIKESHAELVPDQVILRPAMSAERVLIEVPAFIPLIILLLLITVFLERSYEIIRKYQKHPTYIETHFVPQYHASFPAITVCALHGYKSEVLEVKLYVLYFCRK